MKPKKKPCKALSKEIRQDVPGCGQAVLNRKYGLCQSCYAKWLLTTDKGKETLNRQTLKAKGSYTKEEIKKAQKQKREYYKKNPRKQDVEKELEMVFNEFIRLRDKDKPCVSCDAEPGKYTMSAGHYFPAGSNKNIRFDEDNVHGQCWYNCNKNKHGNLSEYLPRLIQRIGQERFDALKQRKNTPRKYTIPELKGMIEYYKLKVKELKKL